MLQENDPMKGWIDKVVEDENRRVLLKTLLFMLMIGLDIRVEDYCKHLIDNGYGSKEAVDRLFIGEEISEH